LEYGDPKTMGKYDNLVESLEPENKEKLLKVIQERQQETNE
jgi:hypothetical protein